MTRRKTPVIGADVPRTWVTWYNKQPLATQRTFDNAAGVIDRGGYQYSKDGSQAGWVENWKNQAPVPSFYEAIVNYRDTGGRTALANPSKNYGDKPISVAKSGGPIEKSGDGWMLRPGRYAYTSVGEQLAGFKKWLKTQPQITVGKVQISESVLPGGDPYYQDFELLITKDTQWPPTATGVPTWLPEGVDIIAYWGKVTPPAGPDWSALPKLGKGLFDFGTSVLLLAAIGGGYYIYTQTRVKRLVPKEEETT